MTDARKILAGQLHMITRRCTQRQFLMRPDVETNNAFVYCLAEAAQRYRIEVVLLCAMSNHYHAVILDRHGLAPAFTEHFHKMFAKSQNVLRGRWENFWSNEQVNMVEPQTLEDLMRQLVYVATNPVEAHLVEKVHHWPGANGLSALLRQQPLRAHRPRHFFRADGPMPAEVTLSLGFPPELGDAGPLLRDLRERVVAVEARVAADRAKTGARVLGRRMVLRQSWRDSPSTYEPRRTLRPKFAARNKWARIEALQRNRDFVVAYREARRRWLAGEQAFFPIGTYWLRRFAGVPITGLPGPA